MQDSMWVVRCDAARDIGLRDVRRAIGRPIARENAPPMRRGIHLTSREHRTEFVFIPAPQAPSGILSVGLGSNACPLGSAGETQGAFPLKWPPEGLCLERQAAGMSWWTAIERISS